MSILLLAVEANSETYGVNLIDIMTQASPMVMVVLYGLIVMSVVCWFIIGYKWHYFRRARETTKRFMDVFWTNKRLDTIFEASEGLKDSPAARVFREAYLEMTRLRQKKQSGNEDGFLTGFENVERAVKRAAQQEVTRFESLVPFLATTGSTAPFIGLFGTVWGIVEAFDRIPKHTGGVILDKVAGPMAHALVATAIGLLAAIPAVMAYNWFVRKIKVAVAEVDSFSAEFLNIVRRHFFK